jgi:tRNA nucleotidyltransferase/poly(A) polymerase
LSKLFLTHELLQLKPADKKLYLVGGAVRDVLIQREGHDYDLICDFDTRSIARAFADRQKGAYYLLDAERNTSRVIVADPSGMRVYYDFARMRGESLEMDLRGRDFTINAMAIDLEAPERIIDPLGGAQDLKDKVLRICSLASFEQDAVRVIRAVRYAVGLNLSIEAETLQQLKAAVTHLDEISGERSRDELLKVLECHRPDVGLRLLHRLGILDALEMGLSGDLMEIAARRVAALEALFGELEGIGKREATQALPMASFLLSLGRFKEPILAYVHDLNSADRCRRTLDLVAAWFMDAPVNDFLGKVEKLKLSNAEKEHLRRLRETREALNEMRGIPDRRQIYRFFKQSPIDACFLWLAELQVAPAAERNTQNWLVALEKVERLIDAWVNHPEIVSPQPLVDGKDLMRRFALSPGRQVGQLLEALREEQAAGTVATREEAFQWAQREMKDPTVQNNPSLSS